MTEVKYDIGGGKEIIAEYGESGFMEITRECFEALIEKQIPKKPIDVQKPVVWWGICPTCKGLPEELGRPHRVFQSDNYCSNCGQKIDWSDVE